MSQGRKRVGWTTGARAEGQEGEIACVGSERAKQAVRQGKH